jgi:hypothetical protein
LAASLLEEHTVVAEGGIRQVVLSGLDGINHN